MIHDPSFLAQAHSFQPWSRWWLPWTFGNTSKACRRWSCGSSRRFSRRLASYGRTSRRCCSNRTPWRTEFLQHGNGTDLDITLCFLHIYMYEDIYIYLYIIIFDICMHRIYKYVYILCNYYKQDIWICVYTSIITSVSRHQKISSQVSQPSRLVILRPNGSYEFSFEVSLFLNNENCSRKIHDGRMAWSTVSKFLTGFARERWSRTRVMFRRRCEIFRISSFHVFGKFDKNG